MKTIRERVIEHLEVWKHIDTHMFGKDNERIVRQVLSEYRKAGNIFIPMANHYYIHESRVNQDDLNKFYRSQLKHLQTQYFNTVRPIGKLSTDKKLKALMGTLDMALGEDL